MKMTKKRWLIAALSVSLFALFSSAMVLLPSEGSMTEAQAQSLVFDTQTWKSESGQPLTGGGSISVDKTADAGENKLLIHTEQSYEDFHLQYTFQYSDASVPEPWQGNSGVLLHSSGTGVDGYYIGFYNWDGNLWCSTGYWRDETFHLLFGVDAGWIGAGLNENTVDIYVKDSHVNVLINGWLFQNAPLPYEQSGAISLYSDGISGTYSAFSVETLDENYDLTSKLVRANWSGSNVAGDMWYWNDAGLDHTFRMRLPDETAGVQDYWLVRRSKVSDTGQSVNVYIDGTASLGMEDEWMGTPIVWGDAVNRCTHGNSMFGLNALEIPVSAFDGAAAGAEIGFYIDKNTSGWYSAAEYWLLYRDAVGTVRVADYMDMAYAFDREAHSFAYDPTNSGEKGYHFVCQANGIITSHLRGQEVQVIKLPELYLKDELEYTFAVNEEEKTFDLSQYVSLKTNHMGCKLVCSVDGGEDTEFLALPAQTGTGTITVKCIPDGTANDLSGAIYFDPVTLELPYSTVRELPEGELIKRDDPVVYSTDEGQTVDLRDYVETDIEGTWSYSVGGETHDGSLYPLPRTDTEEEVVLTVTPDTGEAESVVLQVQVKAYLYPQAISLPMQESCTQVPGTEWLPLYGAVGTEQGRWTAGEDNVWGVLADLGTDSYTFQATVNASDATKDKTRHGFLLHADIGVKGYSGLLIGLEYRGELGALWCSVGWLADGEYIALSAYDTYFDYSADYNVKFICQGSFVEMMINGYRVFTVMDKYGTGGRIAILNDGSTVTYSAIKAAAFDDNIADYVFRSDWNGTDTFSAMASWDAPFCVTFALPNAADAENFRLVRRTFMGDAQAAEISAAEQSFGTWSIASGKTDYGDSAFPLEGFAGDGESATFTVSPQGTFSASYMWLIYTSEGVDYIADSVYFGHAEDAAAHGVSVGSLAGSDKRFIPSANDMLLTFAPGECAIWARNVSLTEYMTAHTWSDSAVSSVALPYRLYLPKGYDASREYPLLVFLHGAGERGNNNTAQISTGAVMGTELLLKRIVLGDYADDFIIVAPQCPSDMRWVERDWTGGTYDFAATAESVPMQLVRSLLHNEILEKYSVDRSRIYGAGLSMGGFGIMDLAAREPGLFAAIVNCAGGADETVWKSFATTAVRAYHSETDTTVNNDALLAFVRAAQAAGQDASYNEVAQIGHYSWQAAFEDVDLISWLLAHEKVWTVQTVLDGGSLTEYIPQFYAYDDGPFVLPVPSKEGFRFDGWYLDAAYTQPVESFTGKDAQNLTLYANWVKDVSVQIVSDGSPLAELIMQSGETLDLSDYTVQKEGHLLIGWSDGVTSYAPTAQIIVSDDIVLEANWQKSVYTVIVMYGDEELSKEQTAYGETFEFSAPSLIGKTFVGLYTDAACTQKIAAPYTVAGNVTLYAKYEEQMISVTLTVGTESRTEQIAYGEMFVPEAVEQDGYIFEGWYYDDAFTQPVQSFSATQDVTLYARLIPLPAPGLDAGAIAGICIGSIAGAALVAGMIVFLIRRKKK